MFGEVAMEIDMEKFDHIFDSRKAKARKKLDTDLTADDLKVICEEYKKVTGFGDWNSERMTILPSRFLFPSYSHGFESAPG
jgi:hypothetical protein